jgi:hypothetical protein
LLLLIFIFLTSNSPIIFFIITIIKAIIEDAAEDAEALCGEEELLVLLELELLRELAGTMYSLASIIDGQALANFLGAEVLRNDGNEVGNEQFGWKKPNFVK